MCSRFGTLRRWVCVLMACGALVVLAGCEKADPADGERSAVSRKSGDGGRTGSLPSTEARAKRIVWGVSKGEPHRVELVAEIARLDEAIAEEPEQAGLYLDRGSIELTLSEYCMPTERHNLQMWAMEDFERAHEMAGGDPLVDSESGKVLSLKEAEALDADQDGLLLKIPDVRRIGSSKYVRTDEAGAEVKVGGPGLAEALVGICRILQKQYRVDEAAEVTKRAELVDPNDFSLQVYKAMMAGNSSGEWSKAAKELEALASQAEGKKQLMAKACQGIALGEAGELDAAEKVYREVLAVDEKHDLARTRLGYLLVAMEREEEAEEYFSSFVEVQHSDILRANNMGNQLRSDGKPAEAVSLLRRVVEMSPGFPAGWNNLGGAYSDMGKLDEAIEAYQNAVKALPVYVDAYVNLGLVLCDAGRRKDAKVAYFTAMQIDPSNERVYYSAAYNYAELKEYENAEKYYTKHTEVAPDDPRGWANLAWVLRRLDRDTEAEVAYLRALAIDKKHAVALNGLGIILQDRGQGEHAFEYYARACDVDPTFSVYIGNLNRVAEQNEMFEPLIKKLSVLMEREGVSPKLWLLRASAYCMLDRFDQAIEDCDHGVKNAPSTWKSNFLHTRAMCHMLKGDDRSAISDLEESMSLSEGYGYPALWAWAIHTKNGDGAAAKAIAERTLAKVDSEKYIASLLKYSLGEMDEQTLIDAAEYGDHKCEAYYYIGVKKDIEGDAESAVEWFKKCVGTRLADNYEYGLAYHELKSRGAVGVSQ